MITDFGGSPTFMKFDVKGNSTMDTTVTSSRENGTTFYETTVVMNLIFQEEKTQAEIKLLAVSRPHIIVEDYNGNFRLVGKDHGCELTTGTFSNGLKSNNSDFEFHFTASAYKTNAIMWLYDFNASDKQSHGLFETVGQDHSGNSIGLNLSRSTKFLP